MIEMNLLASQMSDPRAAWAPVAILLVVGILFAALNIALSLLVGPSRTGPGKETTYESGMVPIGDTRRRFNVRFYLVAIMFVAFDVEVVVLYPWAAGFAQAMRVDPGLGSMMLGGMIVFVLLILLGYVYDLGKGVFRWD